MCLKEKSKKIVVLGQKIRDVDVTKDCIIDLYNKNYIFKDAKDKAVLDLDECNSYYMSKIAELLDGGEKND